MANDIIEIKEDEIHGVINPEDIHGVESSEPEGISKKQSTLMGSQQGLTFGFADEIGGKTQQLMDWIAEMTGGQSVTAADKKVAEQLKMNPEEARLAGLLTTRDDLYKKATDENRAEYKAAQEANPASYFAGEFAGGMLNAPAMLGAGKAVVGAAGALAKGAKATKALDAASKVGRGVMLVDEPAAGAARALLGKSGGATGLEAIGNRIATSTLAEGMGAGATYGGIAGAGASEADTLGGVLKDTRDGMVVGGLTGGALPVLGSGIGKARDMATEFAQDSKFARQLGNAFDAGMDKVKVYGKRANEAFTKEARETLSGLSKKVNQVMNEEGQKVQKILQSSEGDKLVAGVPQAISKAYQLVGNARFDEAARRQATGVLDEIAAAVSQKPNLTAREAYEIKRKLQDLLYDSTLKSKDAHLQRELVQVERQIRDDLYKAVNSLKQPNEKMSAVFELRGLIGGGVRDTKGGMARADEDAISWFNKLGRQLDTSKDQQTAEIDELLKKVLPNDATHNVDNLKNLSDKFELAKIYEKGEPLASSWIDTLVGTSKGLGIATFNQAGRATRATKDALSTAGKELGPFAQGAKSVTKKVIDANPIYLTSLAKKVGSINTPASQELARLLTEASSRDRIARNALIFSLVQNPSYREMMEMGDTDEDTTDGQ